MTNWYSVMESEVVIGLGDSGDRGHSFHAQEDTMDNQNPLDRLGGEGESGSAYSLSVGVFRNIDPPFFLGGPRAHSEVISSHRNSHDNSLFSCRHSTSTIHIHSIPR